MPHRAWIQAVLHGRPASFRRGGTVGPAVAYTVAVTDPHPPVSTDITVRAQLVDAGGRAVATSGLVVTWGESGTGGAFSSATSATDAGGLATVTFTTTSTGSASTAIMATDTNAMTGVSETVTTQAVPTTTANYFAEDYFATGYFALGYFG